MNSLVTLDGYIYIFTRPVLTKQTYFPLFQFPKLRNDTYLIDITRIIIALLDYENVNIWLYN